MIFNFASPVAYSVGTATRVSRVEFDMDRNAYAFQYSDANAPGPIKVASGTFDPSAPIQSLAAFVQAKLESAEGQPPGSSTITTNGTVKS